MSDVLPTDLQRSAARARRWLSVALVALLVVLLLERLGYARVYHGDATMAGLAAQLVFALPALVQLGALWQLRAAAATVAEGQAFAPAVVRGLGRTGAWLIAGSVIALTMPLVHYLLRADYPRSIDLDVAVAILAAIGGGLIFIARLVARAAAVQNELDAFF